MFCLAGCGNITVSPRNCKGSGEYGTEKAVFNKSVVKEFYSFMVDKEVKLNDIVDCKKIDKMKIVIEKKMFLKYIVKVEFKEDK